MVLCGIGGNTIEAAQNNMSYEEFERWAAYRRKRGSLNVGLRVEHMGALLASLYCNAHKKEEAPRFTIFDFANHLDEPELTLDDLKETL